MSTLAELTAIGTQLGYSGSDLADFIKEQQEFERAQRFQERESEKEVREAERLAREAEHNLVALKLQAEKDSIAERVALMEAEENAHRVAKERLEEQNKTLQLEITLKSLNNGGSSKEDTATSKFSDKWGTKLIPKFSELDVGKFFIAFEKVAEQLSWPKELWAVLVQSAFFGKAQIVYAALNAADSSCYDKVKSAVLSAYQLIPEAYRQKFRSWRKLHNQTFVEWACQKAVKFDEWLSAEEVTTFDELRDLMLLEDFKNNIPKEVRIHIEEFDIKLVDEAAKAADRFVLSHAQHFRKKFSTETSSAEADVKNKQSPSSPNRGARQVRDMTCYKCGKKGHVKYQCPEVTKPIKKVMLVDTRSVPPRSTKKEVREDKPYDKSFDDFVYRGTVKLEPDTTEDGKSVALLRDTGSCQSCILETSLPKNFVRKSQDYVLLGGFPDTVTSWPLEEVYVESPLISGVLKLAVVSRLPIEGVDLLIGNDVVQGSGTACVPVEGVGSRTVEERVMVCTKPVVPVTRAQSREKMRGEVEDANLDELFTLKAKRKRKPKPKRIHSSVLPEVDETVQAFESVFPDRMSLVKAQREDGEIWRLYEEADKHKSDEDVSKASFFLKKDVLYRLVRPKDVTLDEEWETKEQIVVPMKYRGYILQEAHESQWGGHLGIRKTLSKVKNNFYWPSVKKDVIRHCKTCHQCQMVGKPNQKISKAPLLPIPAMEEPFTQIVIDIVGPLPKTKTGFLYMLTIMDRTTRFPEVIPLRSMRSSIVLKHLMDFFSRYGLPREIQSDQGSNFTSKEFKTKMKELGVKHNLAAAYHPESQGVLERFHSTLKNGLTKYCMDHVEDWDKDLPLLLFSLRSAPSESLGFTPFQMVYGHNVRGPLDLLKEHWDGEMDKVDSLEYIFSFRNKLRTIWEWAQSNLSDAQTKMKTHYDKQTKVRNFEVGDAVLVLIPIPGQLKAQFVGPAIVKKKLNDVDYLVEIPGRRKKYQLCHVNIMKQYYSRSNAAKSVSVVTSIETINEDVINKDYGWTGDNTKMLNNSDSLLKHLETKQADDIKCLFNEYPAIFKDTPGRVQCLHHDVVLKPNVQPIRQAPYRLNPQKAEAVRREVNYMLENDLICPSSSPWSSPVVLVKKENGQDRLCFDYRKVNDLTIADNFPLPRIEDCIDKVGNAVYISKLDILKGYWQVPLTERAREISAFITPEGLFECKVMPFGMRNSASTFQRLMWIITRGLEGCVVYLDDIIIFSDTWNDHMTRLKSMFDAIAEAGLVINLTKCEFGKAEVTYLGHRIGHGIVLPKEKNIEALISFPVPKTKKNVRQFVGLAGYYRRFVPAFSSIVAPITNLLKEKVKFVWDNSCQQAFDKLKAVLCSYPVLRSPNFLKAFKLMVDASDLGVGAVLLQDDDEGIEHPVSYFSKKLNDHQKKYSTIEKETLALILGLQQFEIYVTAGIEPIVVYSDHNPLKFINKFKNKNRRLTNWSLMLQEYNLIMKHVKGKENIIADALSRNV